MSTWQPAPCVRVLKTGSEAGPGALPVFVFPVFSGTTSCFDNLLNSFDSYRRTIYGVNDPYISGNDESLTASFDEWIGLYVAAMKTKQDKGPYSLMGYSQGMHWCWAVAEALRKGGDATAEIIVLDPNFPAWK